MSAAGAGRRVILALPAYNESDNLTPLISEAHQVLEYLGVPYSILVVNDGSSDGTLEVLTSLQQQYPLQIIDHPQNRGLGGAIISGFKGALALAQENPGETIVVCMDADNTHSPHYIPQMADKVWNGGEDIVIASRFREGSKEVGVPLFRRILSRGARALFQVFLRLPDVRDYTCGYRAYRASLLNAAFEKYGEKLITRQGFACTDEVLVKLSTLTRRVTEIPFVLRYDKKRNQSKLPLLRTIYETLKMLVFKH